jgi:hypothetical protein
VICKLKFSVHICIVAETSTLYSRGRKRSRKKFDLDDLDDTHPQKRSKTMEPQITLDSEGFNFGMFL